MNIQVLAEEEKYEGKYVALRSFTDNTVVASGEKPDEVMNKALKIGTVEPVIVFIPVHGVACIY